MPAVWPFSRLWFWRSYMLAWSVLNSSLPSPTKAQTVVHEAKAMATAQGISVALPHTVLDDE